MIFRTLLFFVVMYFLVKIISRLFLPSKKGQQRQRGPSVFYRTFQQFSQQNQHQNGHNRQSTSNSERFEEIEEAEFEDVTDEEKSTSQTPE
jgi:hypothetical protein